MDREVEDLAGDGGVPGGEGLVLQDGMGDELAEEHVGGAAELREENFAGPKGGTAKEVQGGLIGVQDAEGAIRHQDRVRATGQKVREKGLVVRLAPVIQPRESRTY
ncbi:MAG: hypothetical protein Q8L94_13960 [Parvibaculum sp.]|nr:hypothetical protein [Parvibaculum sp.]MDP1628219.1 hypothetical protein [Parvibaculum sp.]MDP2148059.1 hypothetical protein [Parvibaculum sp.]MDP3330353.1 hypothetical protein [Parvibaculum sp.]